MRDSFHSLRVAVVFAFMATPSAWACSLTLPPNWLGRGGRLLQATPEFFWKLEMERLAREYPVVERALTEDRDGTFQPDEPTTTVPSTAAADGADFELALAAGDLRPLDPLEALRQHLAARALIDVARADDDVVLVEHSSEFADYHRGALALRQGSTIQAIAAWTALLQRPPEERKRRSVWAAYMLGKAQMMAAPDQAIAAFRLCREFAQMGFADSVGLAASSYGWEARCELMLGHRGRAAELYLRQFATGDRTAVASLKRVIDNGEEIFDTAASDPLLSRLMTLRLLTRGSLDSVLGEAAAVELNAWQDAIARSGKAVVRDAEYLGWLAYSAGDYERAGRWLTMSRMEGPAALWLAAKLHRRAGQWKQAAVVMKRTMAQLETQRPARWALPEGASDPHRSASGDLGVIQLSRGHFTEAIEAFWRGGLLDDACYVAERVLTADELKAFVDRVAAPTASADRDAAAEATPQWLRDTLARRLVRERRLAEARPYLSAALRPVLDEYRQSLRTAVQTHLAGGKRARAFFAAACIARHHGMELMGTIGEPDGGIWNGMFPVAGPRMERLTGRVTEGLWDETGWRQSLTDQVLTLPVTPAERRRLRAHSVRPERRFHYLTVAAELVERAARLLPTNTLELADVLNTAGNWVKVRDHDTAMRLHQQLEQRCWRTEIGQASIARHWFVPGVSGPWSAELDRRREVGPR